MSSSIAAVSLLIWSSLAVSVKLVLEDTKGVLKLGS
jgi:hypothetical protein